MTPTCSGNPMAEASAILQRLKAKSEEQERSAAAARGPRPDPRPCGRCGEPVPAVPSADGLCWASPDMCEECEQIAVAEERAERRVAALGLTSEQSHCTFANYAPDNDSQRVALGKAWTDTSLWLIGPSGVGKSHRAIAVCIAAAQAGPLRIEHHVAPDLFRRLQREEASGDGMDASIDALRGCDLLVLNDLDKRRSTPLAREALFSITDYRYDHRGDPGARTIITTNGRPSEVAAHFGGNEGKAIVSRLCGLCETLAMDGQDHRLG